MTSCDSAREALAELVFGELDDESAPRLDEHLHGCAACRAHERELLALRESVHGAAAPPGVALRERVRAAVERSRPAPIPLWRRPVPAWGAVAATAACVAIALVAPRPPERLAPRVPEVSEAPGVPITGDPVPFRVAEAYVTRVGPIVSRADSAHEASRRGVDTL